MLACLVMSTTLYPLCSLVNGTNYAMPSGASAPRGVAFSPDGSYLLVSTLDHISVFNFVDGVPSAGILYPMPGSSRVAMRLVFSPDGQYIVTPNGSRDVSVFSYHHGVLNGTSYPKPSGARSSFRAAISPDGNYVIVTNPDVLSGNDISVFRFNAGVLSEGTNYALPGSATLATGVAFSPDGLHVAVAARDLSGGIIAMYSFSNGALSNGSIYTADTDMIYSETSIIFTGDGRYLIVSPLNAGKVTVINHSNGVLSGAVDYSIDLNVDDLTLSGDGTHLLVPTFLPAVGVFDFNEGTLSNVTMYPILSGSDPRAIAFSPDYQHVAVTNLVNNDMTIFKAVGCYTPLVTTTTGKTISISGTASSSTFSSTTSDDASTSPASHLTFVWQKLFLD